MTLNDPTISLHLVTKPDPIFNGYFQEDLPLIFLSLFIFLYNTLTLHQCFSSLLSETTFWTSIQFSSILSYTAYMPFSNNTSSTGLYMYIVCLKEGFWRSSLWGTGHRQEGNLIFTLRISAKGIWGWRTWTLRSGKTFPTITHNGDMIYTEVWRE